MWLTFLHNLVNHQFMHFLKTVSDLFLQGFHIKGDGVWDLVEAILKIKDVTLCVQ